MKLLARVFRVTSPCARAAAGPCASLGPSPLRRRLRPSFVVLARPLKPYLSDNCCCSRLCPQPPEFPGRVRRTALVSVCLRVGLGAAAVPCGGPFFPEMDPLSLALLRSTPRCCSPAHPSAPAALSSRPPYSSILAFSHFISLKRRGPKFSRRSNRFLAQSRAGRVAGLDFRGCTIAARSELRSRGPGSTA